MIVFDIKCDSDHIFEVWFDNSLSFQNQLKKKLISCPYCNSNNVIKSIMSPNISTKSSSSNKNNKKLSIYNNYIKKIKSEILSKSEYVGREFSKEARKIHYGESNNKSIYGEATNNEVKDLVEEGIELIRLPWALDKKKN